MTPEEKARNEIDRQLAASGWLVQDYKAMDLSAGRGIAVREFPLKGGNEADYLLYAGGKAISVVEAKPEGYTLTGVETQSKKYVEGLPKLVPAHVRPLPFSYESTGPKRSSPTRVSLTATPTKHTIGFFNNNLVRHRRRQPTTLARAFRGELLPA